MLSGRNVLVCVGGGIAAYKSAILARELLRRGARVRVAMTPSATKFVGPITFTGLTSHDSGRSESWESASARRRALSDRRSR